MEARKLPTIETKIPPCVAKPLLTLNLSGLHVGHGGNFKGECFMDYSESLRSPLWQKKRLEIMSLHNFTCQSCKEKNEQLNVHHISYKKGKKPWEYDNCNFMCLCKTCHENYHRVKIAVENGFSSCFSCCNGSPSINVDDGYIETAIHYLLKNIEGLQESMSVEKFEYVIKAISTPEVLWHGNNEWSIKGE